MRSVLFLLSCKLGLLLAALPVAALAQNALRIAPVPRGPLELAAGKLQVADTQAPRDAAVQLLARARNSYALRNLHRPWDLKVHFTVDSRGQTDYDGDWEMEDIFAPGEGLHWAAKSAGGYAITGIFAADGATYADATSGVIPLRLQEARSMLYNPIPSVAYASSGSIRTIEASFGSPVTCVLLSRSRASSAPPDQRSWDESEDCIDSQTGLLRIHSEIPGRYAVYDYSNAARLGSHTLPRTITVWEGGRVVSTISVESLQPIASADPALFVPTDGMKAAGPAVTMAAAMRLARLPSPVAATPGTTLRPVCVFGLVTPAGHLVEAHSLQPVDPNSEAALKDAEAIDFSPAMRAGAAPQQHFVFVIEKFAVSEK